MQTLNIGKTWVDASGEHTLDRDDVGRALFRSGVRRFFVNEVKDAIVVHLPHCVLDAPTIGKLADKLAQTVIAVSEDDGNTGYMVDRLGNRNPFTPWGPFDREKFTSHDAASPIMSRVVALEKRVAAMEAPPATPAPLDTWTLALTLEERDWLIKRSAFWGGNDLALRIRAKLGL